MSTSTTGPAPGSADAIVGRRRELEALTAWLAAARGGRGRLVLCAGEAGIGKTRLAQELDGARRASTSDRGRRDEGRPVGDHRGADGKGRTDDGDHRR